MPVGPSYCDVASPRSSISAGSDAVPVIAHRSGVGHVAEQRAEGDHHLARRLGGDVDHRAAERLPPEVRLDAAQHHEVAFGEVHLEALVARPDHAAGDAVDQLDLGPMRLEVDVLVRIDRREPSRIVLTDEPVGGARGGVAGVVPARERGDEERSTEGGTSFPHQPVGHRASLGPPSRVPRWAS